MKTSNDDVEHEGQEKVQTENVNIMTWAILSLEQTVFYKLHIFLKQLSHYNHVFPSKKMKNTEP